MNALVATVLGGVGFGLAIAAPPGPMNAIIAEESVIRGWLSGFTAGLGAMSADALFFIGTVLGVLEVVRALPWLRSTMVAIGGVLMLYFAYGAGRDAMAAWEGEAGLTGGSDSGGESEPESGGPDADVRGNESTEPGHADVGDHATGFKKAFVLALTNPYQVVFWLTVGVAMLQPGQLDVLAVLPAVGEDLAGAVVVETGSRALVVGFFGGIALWIVGFPASLVTVGRRVDSFATLVAAGSAAVLALFGIGFLGDALRSVL